MIFQWVKRQLIRSTLLKRPIQAIRVAKCLMQPFRFLRDIIINSGPRVYTSRRTGETLVLRARRDLQVARELVSKDAYTPHNEIQSRISGQTRQVLDCGANIGLFTLFVLRSIPSCSVIAIEPDAENYRLLQLNIARNGYHQRVVVYEAAVGIVNGVARFAGGACEKSMLAGDDDQRDSVTDVRLLDFYEVAASADYVKIDIEGGEWVILRDPRLKTLQANIIALEWHQELSLTNQPEREVTNLLHQAGYNTALDPSLGMNAGFVWAWRD